MPNPLKGLDPPQWTAMLTCLPNTSVSHPPRCDCSMQALAWGHPLSELPTWKLLAPPICPETRWCRDPQTPTHSLTRNFDNLTTLPRLARRLALVECCPTRGTFLNTRLVFPDAQLGWRQLATLRIRAQELGCAVPILSLRVLAVAEALLIADFPIVTILTSLRSTVPPRPVDLPPTSRAAAPNE